MVFDAHSDIWTDVTNRYFNGERNIFSKYHYNRFQKGGIEGSIFAIWIDTPHIETRPYERFLEMKEAIENEIAVSKDFVIVKNIEEIQKAKQNNQFYVIIGIEGLSSIGENLDLIDVYYDIGARHAMLTWNEQNALATGAKGDSKRGLTNIGKKAVKKMIQKNMILDVSHLNEKSFWDLTELAQSPIIASHSNVKAICDVPRNLTDEQILKIRDLNGVIGVNAFHGFIHVDPSKQNLNHLIKHVIYIADKIGVEHVGCGFDFVEFLPLEKGEIAILTKDLEDSSKVQNFVQKLKEAGFSKKEIENICYGNFHRVIEQVLI